METLFREILRCGVLCLNRTMQYGNHVLEHNSSVFRVWFKSYYVVWKHTHIFFLVSLLHCLNRTMQYGNTGSTLGIFLLQNSLNRTMQYGNQAGRVIGTPILFEFKSYYVVWKLFFILFLFIFLALFKSYYVVWKLILFFLFISISLCLNRTMQYGNYSEVLWSYSIRVGLNRTMQYGNLRRNDAYARFYVV